jgi:CheY-like chemotaxis protein
MPKPNASILIVDDDAETATMLARSLARRGYSIDATQSAEDALLRVETHAYDAALLDLVMPGRDGMALASALRTRLPLLPIALLTGYTHSPLLAGAERERIAVFIKPVVVQELVEFLEREIAR